VTRYQVVPLCQFPHKSGHRGGCLTSVRVISNFTSREPSGRVWTRLMSILKPSSIVQVTERLIVYLKVNLKKVIETEKQHFKEELHCKKKIVPEFAQEHWQNATFQLMKVLRMPICIDNAFWIGWKINTLVLLKQLNIGHHKWTGLTLTLFLPLHLWDRCINVWIQQIHLLPTREFTNTFWNG